MKASVILSDFSNPPKAKSGLPPPDPPKTLATSLTMSPARITFVKSLLKATQNSDFP